MIVLKTLAKRDSEWFTDSLFAGGRYSIHWGEGWDEYFTSASTVIWRTAKRKKIIHLIMFPFVNDIKCNKKRGINTILSLSSL